MMEILTVENTVYATNRKRVLEDLKMLFLSLDRKMNCFWNCLFSGEQTVRMAPQSY